MTATNRPARLEQRVARLEAAGRYRAELLAVLHDHTRKAKP